MPSPQGVGLICHCGLPLTVVVETRKGDKFIRRIRQCSVGHRSSTLEVALAVVLKTNEQALIADLIAGLSPRECATKHEVSLSTVYRIRRTRLEIARKKGTLPERLPKQPRGKSGGKSTRPVKFVSTPVRKTHWFPNPPES